MDKIITKKCKKCGGNEFYKDGKCGVCSRARGKKYSAEHSEEKRVYSQKYHAEHAEEDKSRCRNYQAANPEKIRIRKKAYRDKHPDEIRTSGQAWYDKNSEEKKAYARNYYATHSEERRTYAKAYRVAHPEKIMALYLAYTYDMTAEEYAEKLAIQNGVCAICGSAPSGRRLVVDHDHATGEVRGLLCERCNTVLGRVSDSTNILIAAIEYLKSNQSIHARHKSGITI